MIETIKHPVEEFGQFPWEHYVATISIGPYNSDLPRSSAVGSNSISLTYVKPLPNPKYEEICHIWTIPHGLVMLLIQAVQKGEKNIQDGIKRQLGIMT